MKIVKLPIEMIAWFTKEGIPHPIKFRMIDHDKSFMTIKVGRVLCREKEKLAGNVMYVFRCESAIDGTERIYELKYELETCKWILFKL